MSVAVVFYARLLHCSGGGIFDWPRASWRKIKSRVESEKRLSLVVCWPGSGPNLFNNSRDIARDTFLLVFGANIIAASERESGRAAFY